jgi:hypothetical protein
MEKELLRRDHWKSKREGIWEASGGNREISWRLEATERRLGGILERFLMHLGQTWESSGGSWRLPGTPEQVTFYLVVVRKRDRGFCRRGSDVTCTKYLVLQGAAKMSTAKSARSLTRAHIASAISTTRENPYSNNCLGNYQKHRFIETGNIDVW